MRIRGGGGVGRDAVDRERGEGYLPEKDEETYLVGVLGKGFGPLGKKGPQYPLLIIKVV